MNILNLTSKQLKQAAKLKDKIGGLENQLAKMFGGNGSGMPSPFIRKGKRKMSAAGRLAIAAAQKLRWSKIKGKSSKPKTAKRKMSAAAKAKIAKAAKARWAKAKAAAKIACKEFIIILELPPVTDAQSAVKIGVAYQIKRARELD